MIECLTCPAFHGDIDTTGALLSCRYKPGSLTEAQSKLLGLPMKELTLCITDIAGSTALWEWNPRVMDKAQALQEQCLRSLLPKHCGHEVRNLLASFVAGVNN